MQDKSLSRRSRRATRLWAATASLLSISGKHAGLRVIIIGTDIIYMISSIVTLLDSASGITVVSTFATASDPMTKLKRLNPHVALISLALPDAIACVETIEKQRPQTAVLMVGETHAQASIEAIMGSGAAGLLVEPFSAEELQLAIYAAVQGEFVLSHSAAELLRHHRASSRAAFIQGKKLNSREVRVLDLLASFLQNNEIADQLRLSIPMAEKLLRSVFRKLNVQRRSEAIVLWASLR